MNILKEMKTYSALLDEASRLFIMGRRARGIDVMNQLFDYSVTFNTIIAKLGLELEELKVLYDTLGDSIKSEDFIRASDIMYDEFKPIVDELIMLLEEPHE